MRVAIIGCGAVAAVHAAALRRLGVSIAAVCDSNIDKARSFASRFGVARSVAGLSSALEEVDAVLVTSPSPLHYEHAIEALGRECNVLVELPPCESAGEASLLDEAARRSNLVLRCAHTSRYLEPYQRIGDWIRERRLGQIRHLHYWRRVVPARRDWADNAWLHHAAHPVDLFLHWFGSLETVGCTASPCGNAPTDVSMLARLPNGAPASIAISYSAKEAGSRLDVIGEECTIVTDGLSFLHSSHSEMNWQRDATNVYEQAIASQDLDFIRCCETGDGGVSWWETTRMILQMQGGCP